MDMRQLEDAEDPPEVEGVEDARERVLTFLTDTVGTVDASEITGILYQSGLIKDPIWTFHFGPNEDKDELAEEVLQKAGNNLKDHGGSHRIHYKLKLLHHNGNATFPLWLKRPENDVHEAQFDNSINPTDLVPNVATMIQQQMVNNQILLETAVGGSREQIKLSNKMLERAYKRIEYLENKLEESFESREAVMSLQHERDLETKREEKKQQYMGQVISTGINAFAPLVNKVVKQKLMPETVTPLEGQIIALASTITAEKVQKLIASGAFDLAQLQNFLAMVKQVQDRQEEIGREQHPASGGTSTHQNGPTAHAGVTAQNGPTAHAGGNVPFVGAMASNPQGTG